MQFDSQIKSRIPWLALHVMVMILSIGNFTGLHGQNISGAEYFFDSDPGVGNGTPINIIAPSGEVTFPATISTTGLEPGYHILYVRTKSSDDLWSLYEYREFIIESPIQQAEYFFDEDPGVGNGTALAVLPGAQSITSTIPTTGLDDGEHLLFLRTRQAGQWSLSEPIAFYIQTRIVEAEYFIDTDPGLGNGISIAVGSPSDEVNITASVSVGALASGVHYLFVRTKDIFGNWSFYEGQEFTIDPALPVELKDLTATVTAEKNVAVTWSTLVEKMSDHFSVMRSEDGQSFSAFAQVAAAGESRIPRNYSAVDHHPLAGNNYYRLKMVDIDGQYSFSNIVVARLSEGIGAAIYPNPIVENWVIDFSQSEKTETRSVDLFDLNGRKKISFITNEKIIQMNRDGISSGIYVLKVTSADGTTTYKINFR